MGGMGGMPGRQRQRQRERADTVPNESSVFVRGLQGAAQHNGKRGKTLQFEAESGRHVVELEDGETLRIKPENLLQRAAVEVTGMEKRPEYNGRQGHVEGYDEASGRYHVRLGAQTVALQPASIILATGSRGRVVGLVNGAQYNQRVGKVLDFDRGAGRYVVQLDEEHQLRVKPANLML